MNGGPSGRRQFLQVTGGAAAGLVVGIHLAGSPAAATGPFAPNAFVRVAPDGAVTVVVNKSEMGQGIHTALAMLVAEELDCDWERIRVEAAPVTPEYNDPIAREYVTAGSTSIVSSWGPFRDAGAAARLLLVAAAARTWNIDAGRLRTAAGRVYDDAAGRSASYGELAATAAALPPPERVPLKHPGRFRIIGQSYPRLEGRDKVTAKAEFSIDVRLPGMLTAVVARPPVVGGKLRGFRAPRALSVPGVVRVKRISSGVAVLARDFWSARLGRDALELDWDHGPNAGLSTADLRRRYRELLDQPGRVAEDAGSFDRAFASANRIVQAVYEVPFLAHAPMEPLNAVAHVRRGACDVWAGTEYQSMDHRVAMAITGLKPDQVRIHTTLMGGAFGRRANPTSDFVAEAVEAAKGERVPVKVVWTREDDIRGGYYRPMFLHKLEAGLDASGAPIAWRQRMVGQSIGQGTRMERLLVTGEIDMSSVIGAYMPYAVHHRRIEVHNAEPALSVLWWRSVGHSHNGFATECFLDEVAHAGRTDPLELRRRLLDGQPRHLAVLDLAAEKAGWGSTLPSGRARGVALRRSFDTVVAQVAEVSLEPGGQVRVHRVVCAVDCGAVINPRNVAAQMESAIVYGLSAALYGEITVDNGRIRQSNFHDYPILRFDRMPVVDVHLVGSRDLPTGVGEPGLPPIAPAVANALFALTGKRIRKLPIRLEEAV